MFVDSLGNLTTIYDSHILEKESVPSSKYLTWGEWLGTIAELDDLYWGVLDLALCGIKLVRNSFILQTFIFCARHSTVLDTANKGTAIRI